MNTTKSPEIWLRFHLPRASSTGPDSLVGPLGPFVARLPLSALSGTREKEEDGRAAAVERCAQSIGIGWAPTRSPPAPCQKWPHVAGLGAGWVGKALLPSGGVGHMEQHVVGGGRWIRFWSCLALGWLPFSDPGSLSVTFCSWSLVPHRTIGWRGRAVV